MFERFSHPARNVVVRAQEEARGLDHNYIGTEHVLLGLLGEREGVAAQVLADLGFTTEAVREEVLQIVGRGSSRAKGHIPFTPRAKKVLELSLREALHLRHDYIGTEHILLGLIREGEGVAAQILLTKAEGLEAAREAVLALVTIGTSSGESQNRLARLVSKLLRGGDSGPLESSAGSGPDVTPAATGVVATAADLAGGGPVGSQHLMRAALVDEDSSAVKALRELGVDLDALRLALTDVDVTGTSDEEPADAGIRQMSLSGTTDLLTLTFADPVLLELVRNRFVGVLPEVGSPFAPVWQALHDALLRTPPTQSGPPPDEAA